LEDGAHRGRKERPGQGCAFRPEEDGKDLEIFIEKALREGEKIYGVTTGFGSLSDQVIDRSRIEALQRNLLRSHSVGVGPVFDEVTTRAIMLLRANVLAMGYSGVRFEVVRRLADMLNQGVHPLIPEQGSVGASGDLAPLAHLASVLIGEGEAVFHGKVMAGKKAMAKAGIAMLTLKSKEGLALINGTQVMTAVGLPGASEGRTALQDCGHRGCLHPGRPEGEPASL